VTQVSAGEQIPEVDADRPVRLASPYLEAVLRLVDQQAALPALESAP
jgi:hypothetical protein